MPPVITLLALGAIFFSVISLSLATPLHRRINPRFPYGDVKVRGVNIGGWLVLEPWITPSLFENTGNNAIVDEWTFGALQNYNVAQAALTNHWNNFITESDFAQIAAAGLNHVRIPIGYWAFDISGGEPYHTGQYQYLKMAVGWAGNHGLKVWIGLHGVPGSQNGLDNSGRFGTIAWQTNSSNIARTTAIIRLLTVEFSLPQYASVVTSIEVINEPAGYFDAQLLDVTRKYYYDSYGIIRYPVLGSSVSGDLVEVIADAFQPLTYWTGFMPSPTFEGVIMDTHHYQIFTDAEVGLSWEQHIAVTCARGNEIEAFAAGNRNLWTVVGEWSTAIYDCAKWLNGRNVGARYDGSLPGSTVHGSCIPFTGPASVFSAEYKAFMRQYWEAQTLSFEKAEGWIYWTWKTEVVAEWSYQAGLAGGWIPSDPNWRIYPNICG